MAQWQEEVVMTTRSRNTILVFAKDIPEVRDLVGAARADGWDVRWTMDVHDALCLFIALRDRLALVVTDDDQQGPSGVEFLQQQSTQMFFLNIPFVLLMFTRQEDMRTWVTSAGGWVVFMKKHTNTLLKLFAYLEHAYRPNV